MPTRIDLSAIPRLRRRLGKLAVIDARPLMVSFMKIIADDNRRGVLAGLDKDGRPMVPVTYRPVGKPKRVTPAQRNIANRKGRPLRGRFGGLGPMAAGLHNNLTTREYERLGGPPLAPRSAYSRVITNLLTGFQRLSPARWEAYGYWDQVVSTRGVPFLHAHFIGARAGRNRKMRLPRRDLRGVRQQGKLDARRAAVNFVRDLMRTA